MTRTDSFDGFGGFPPDLSDMPTDPTNLTPEDTGKSKVVDINALRESREYLKARERESERIRDLDPPWNDDAYELQAAGWSHSVVMGVRIWIHPDHGLWKSEDVALYITRNTIEEGTR